MLLFGAIELRLQYSLIDVAVCASASTVLLSLQASSVVLTLSRAPPAFASLLVHLPEPRPALHVDVAGRAT
jgi:hypothetical protein